MSRSESRGGRWYREMFMSPVAAHPRSSALAPFVAALHYHVGEARTMLERVLPSARVHLMVNLYEDEFRSYTARIARPSSGHAAQCWEARARGLP